ncbi:glycosyltransferase family 4 protein [Candidatus Dojkabacteria bacterium]|nr:glycosyltransferase family 4 protein [Candidatus Dojkabacteria bacterium]
MLKIIQITTFFYPVHGGVEQMVLQLSKRLKEIGHEVKIFCSDSSKGQERITPLKETIEGIEVERCRTWFSLSYFHKFYPSLLIKLLKSDFDILHVQGIKKVESYIALFVAKLRGKKVIVSTHNPFIVDPKERSRMSNRLIKLHDLTFGKLFLKYFDKFICLSKEEYKHLAKFGVKKDKITVIPNAVPDIIWQKGSPEKIAKRYKIDKSKWDSIVLSLGRISRRKGLQNLEYAIKSLSKTLFLLAGPDDGYVPKLKNLFRNYHNVMFLGAIERNETKDVYELADIWVIPSLYEPFGVVLIEAMAKGLPSVSTNIGGPTEIVKKEFGFLVNPKDQKQIKERLEFLTKRPQIRKKMGKAAILEAKKYAWDKIFKKYLEVYNKLIQ